MGRLRLPRPYDFQVSTERYRAYGPDLANPLDAFATWARRDRVLARLVRQLSGFRPTLWVDPFEAVVDCITSPGLRSRT